MATRTATSSSSSAVARKRRADELLKLWRQYERLGDTRTRDRIILTLAPMVKFIVYRKVREMPPEAEAEDFISCGLEALIQSIDRYDPSKGASLEQYAWTRIHGAVLDELRRQDWAPRSVRRWERDIARASDWFCGLHGRRPTTEELCDALGITPADLRRHRGAIARSDMTSLHTLVLNDEETAIERIDTIASDDERLDPEHRAATTEAKEKFRAAFAKLSQREREIAVLLYVKNLTLAEIGDVLGVTESRISQIHTAMKRRLREELDADAEILRLVA